MYLCVEEERVQVLALLVGLVPVLLLHLRLVLVLLGVRITDLELTICVSTLTLKCI